MAFTSVSYTFTNGTAADATQVNTNFTDLVNGLSDSTKDISCAALTCTSFSNTGNTTLGNASSDDITFTGSLASTIPIKTNNSFDIGSATLGLASVYLGSAGGLTTRLVGGATGSSYTMTLPTTGGTSTYLLETNGSGTTTWSKRSNGSELTNFSVSASVGSSALTIAVKSGDGTSFSSTNVGRISFRNSTAGTGTYTERLVTADPTSLVISSGSTLGHTNNQAHYIYVYLVDTGSGLVIGASSTLYDDGALISTTAEGGAGAADSNSIIYTAAGQASKPIRFIGRLLSTQTTAGTWAAVPTEISLLSPGPQKVRAHYHTSSSTLTNSTEVTVSFTTKVLDTHNAYSSGVFTAPKTAFYLAQMAIRVDAFTAATATSVYGCRLIHSGSYSQLDTQYTGSTSSLNHFSQILSLIYMVSGETLTTRYFHNMGATPTIENAYSSFNFQICEI